MKYIGLLAVISVIFISNSSHAGFYIEPGLVYESGDNKLTWPAPLAESTGTTKGMGVNLKLGFHAASVFFMALDGTYTQPRFKQSVNNYEADAKSTLYGLTLGAQMPVIGIRLWAGYIFGGDLDPEESNGVDLKFQEAKGPKVGVGIRLFMLSLNVEYADLEYNKSILEKAGPITGTLDNKLKNKIVFASFSMPLTL
ncbi:MAG: outer membrane beta-barrel protein [Bdellovibrio sp.]